MNFFYYSGCMEADIKSLEAKITKLIGLCSSLRGENALLLGDLAQAQQAADALRSICNKQVIDLRVCWNLYHKTLRLDERL